MIPQRFVTLGLILLFSSTAFGRGWEEIKKTAAIRVAVDGQTPGFNFYKGKDLTGFEVELVKEMARRWGLKVEWTVQPFNTLLIALGQDRFDVIATSHAITPEREKVADMEPLYCTGAQVISRVGGPKTEAELKGKIVAAPVGTVYLAYLQKLSGLAQVKSFPAETDAFQDVINRRSDAAVTDEFVAQSLLKERKDLQGGAVLFSQRNAFVVAKGNQTVRDAVRAMILAVQKDGAYEKLSRQWFERDIRCR